MLRNLLALALAATTAGCEPAGDPYELVVETFNVGLAGAFVPNEAARRPAVVEAMGEVEADVLCLQEVWQQADKDAIVEAARERLPNAVFFEHDLATEVDYPEDQQGEVPPPPSGPPCAGDLEETLEDALACLRTSCSTVPDSEEGHTTSTACAEEACRAQVAGLLLGDATSLRCYACLATGLPIESFADIRELCTTEPNGELAFRGQSGVMILSRLPVRDARDIVLPGTWNRRAIAAATVELPNGAEVDVYCNHTTPIFDGLSFPYTGQYGEGEVDDRGWEAEQALQVRRTVEIVGAAAGRPALVAGDFNVGPASEGVEAVGLPSYEALAAAFDPAVAPGFVPSCTHCPDSPNVSDASEPVWIDHVFMTGIPASAVLETEVTRTERVVEADGGELVELSDHYGLRSRIEIEP